MIFSLLQLEIKSLFRSSQFKKEAFSFFMKLVLGLYLVLLLLGLGVSTSKLIQEYYPNQNVLYVVSGFFIFYWLYDLLLRFMSGGSPVVAIKPLLLLNIKHHYIIKYTLLKGYFKLFNIVHLFYFVPLSIILISQGFSVYSVLLWSLSMLILLSCNSFLSIFLDKVSFFFYVFVGLCTLLGLAQVNGWLDILPIVSPIFYFFYAYSFSIIISFIILIFCFVVTYKYYEAQLYLDKGLKKEDAQVKSLDIKYLASLGSIGAFIKNDLYLIMRNKRPRTTVLMSLLFVFYPFLLVRFNSEVNHMMVFAAIFATGGFMISFGQFVPSWDSAHYPLFMTQNVSYREYLLSKWYIMVIACIITFIICSFYLFISPIFFLALLAGAIFNIGFNSNLILLMGAFVRQPIDLSSNVGAFGNTKAFNVNTLILSLVIFIVPLLIYSLFQFICNEYVGFLAVAFFGCLGFLFRDRVFNNIVKIYKKYKYQTIIDYKQ